MMNGRWEETDDKQGHKPLFELKCKYCDIDLDFRASNIIGKSMNIMGFKCKRCGYYQRFFVKSESSYLLKILKLRGNSPHYFPTYEEWAEDDEKARQLAIMGYFGGR